jgi:hypothetical protein
MSDTFSLLPRPRSLNFLDGQYRIEPERFLVLHGSDPAQIRFSAMRLQAFLREKIGANWALSAAFNGPSSENGGLLVLNPELALPEQGYILKITPEVIRLEAPQVSGIFYGVCTLIQLIEQTVSEGSVQVLPCLEITDWPDFKARGVMLDVSRDKVPTMQTLLTLVDQLAGWKINQLQLYTEHTFAYRNHPEVWAKASPFTGEEILELDAFCRERQIQLVPNQNSFGHMHRWLIHSRYAPLAEVTDGFMTPWGWREGPFSLNPIDPGSLALVRSLYDELLPHFSSRVFNVGCDETFDLGQGRSKEACEKLGSGRVYLDFLTSIYEDVKARGYTMQFWGDIVIQHPDLIPEIPKDMVALEWGYEADHLFDEHCTHFAKAGMSFYVCPGTSSWCSLGGRTANALGNLRNAAEAGLKHGASGYLITDWGDLGHWQFLPVSYLGLASGAAFAWCLEANRDLNIPAVLDSYVFKDSAGVMGQFAYDLGNIYLLPGLSRINASQLFWFLQRSLPEAKKMLAFAVTNYGYTPPTPDTLLEALKLITEIESRLGQSQMNRPDAALIKEEFSLTARLMRHGCLRGLLCLDAPLPDGLDSTALEYDLNYIATAYPRLWLARNRPGGLDDSLGALLSIRTDYLN